MSTDVMSIPTGTPNSDDLSDPHLNNETELRELVYQALERDGLITRIKAQLRAAVFKTIEKASNPTGSNSHSVGTDSVHWRTCRALVLEWLEHAHLLYTEDIFKVETSGPNHPAALTRTELVEQFHVKSNPNGSQPVLYSLLEQNTNRPPASVNSLPDHIKQSIEHQFPTEKINNLNQLREHFRSLFSFAFDPTVLDAFLNKHITSSTTSLPKYTYEEICLKWIQACSNASAPQTAFSKGISSATPTLAALVNIAPSNGQVSTPARRSMSPPNESSSSSSSSSSSPSSAAAAGATQRKLAFEFPLPTTMSTNKSVVKNTTNVSPPALIDFDDDEEEEEDEDTSASIFSKRNATPAALDRLKNIDNIIQGDTTPRTRTVLQRNSANGGKDLPIEYDDESMSQSISHSIVSSIDDITVDKASPSPSAQMDFFEDL